MATIICENKKVEVTFEETPEGLSLIEPCEQLDIIFSCESGICRTCAVEVIEGMELLSPLNENEQDMCFNENERLTCQCKLIKDGTLIIRSSDE